MKLRNVLAAGVALSAISAPAFAQEGAPAADGDPVLGAMNQPFVGERFVGMAGQATLNGQQLRTRALTHPRIRIDDQQIISARDACAFVAASGEPDIAVTGKVFYQR